MFGLRKINPMVRAVGTMGAIAAIAGGVTFAATQPPSNTVALAGNSVAVTSSVLAIDANGNCTATSTGTSTPGLNGAFAPGGTISTSFCIQNTGNTNLTITGVIPTDLSASTVAANTTLDISCTKIGDVNKALTAWNTNQAFPGGTLKAGQMAACTATATLASTFTGSGSVPTFDVNFTGN